MALTVPGGLAAARRSARAPPAAGSRRAGQSGTGATSASSPPPGRPARGRQLPAPRQSSGQAPQKLTAVAHTGPRIAMPGHGSPPTPGFEQKLSVRTEVAARAPAACRRPHGERCPKPSPPAKRSSGKRRTRPRSGGPRCVRAIKFLTGLKAEHSKGPRVETSQELAPKNAFPTGTRAFTQG